MTTMFRKILHQAHECKGCAEIRLPLWRRYCAFCEPPAAADKPHTVGSFTTNDWKPVTRWKENVLVWVCLIVGSGLIGVVITAVLLYLLSLLGVPI